MGTTVKVTVGVEWINNWGGTLCEPACVQGNLSYRDDRAEGFLEEMLDEGHTKEFNWGDCNAWERDFRHPDHGGGSLTTGGGIDTANFVFYSDHGGNWSDTMHIAFCNQVDNCLGASSQWKLGVGELKWLVLDCCQCVLNTTAAHIAAVWFTPAYGIHMIFGYVGNGHDSSSTKDMGKNFGKRVADGDRLGEAWLDTAFAHSPDDNPIVMAFGETQADAINRRDNETINWRDLNIAAANWVAWKWRS